MTLLTRFIRLFRPDADGGDRHFRLAGLLRGVSSSLASKVLSLVISFVSVPLTIGYLGVERYGAWITIGALLSWLGLSDFGLGHGLTNAVTTDASRGRPDLVRAHLSNFMFLMGTIAVLVAAAIAVAWPFLDWARVFGMQDAANIGELKLALIFAFAIFLIRMPLSVSNRVYMAYQEGHLGNYWLAAGNVLGLIALFAVTRTQGGLPWLVFAISGVALLVEIVNTLWLFALHRPDVAPGRRHIRRSGFRQISHIGGQFFLIQIMALVTFQSAALIIARYLGSAAVPEYSITYTLFNYATLPQTLLFPYLWTAYNEAITRGDVAWVRKTFHISLMLGMGAAVAGVAVLMLLGQPFIRWWAGPEVVPTTHFMAMMGAWVVINAFTNPIACLLAAASRLRYQLIYSGIATVANLGLAIALVTPYGIDGVIFATVAAYLVFVCGPTFLDVTRLLRALDRRTDPATH